MTYINEINTTKEVKHAETILTEFKLKPGVIPPKDRIVVIDDTLEYFYVHYICASFTKDWVASPDKIDLAKQEIVDSLLRRAPPGDYVIVNKPNKRKNSYTFMAFREFVLYLH